AHARIASIIRYAESQGVFPEVLPDVRKLIQSEEIGLLKLLSRFRDEVESCVKSFEPHRLAEYLHNVAGSFHQFYHVQRVVTEDQSLTLARIGLCLATKTILANGFSILGITAPEKM
ncbi:MAG TPA: DALR anticodon-binding domain-containing protein, partial [Bacteroidota bacterium]|nr:DALR anticodon-binding domain-containing protein [Bacteroidota bacterium]